MSDVPNSDWNEYEKSKDIERLVDEAIDKGFAIIMSTLTPVVIDKNQKKAFVPIGSKTCEINSCVWVCL
jgi:hypothetical protein